MRYWLSMLSVVIAAISAWAEIVITSPTNGETVCQLYPTQLKFVQESQQERDKYFDGAENAKAMKKDGSFAKPIDVAWTGSDATCTVTVKRLPDGKVFQTVKAKGGKAKIDSLEIARDWELTVSDGKSTAKCTFKTQDQAPRIINLHSKIGNCRDLGGRIGLNGRRIKQGLVFRTPGLNSNAPRIYYTKEEIMELYNAGKLQTMGDAGKHLYDKIKKGKQLHDVAKRNGLVKKEKFEPGKKRFTEEERAAVVARWGFKSDIDLRRDDETFGMEGSPLGPEVTWFHYPYSGYNIGKRECNVKVFKVFLDPNNYPIVFHCIGGADRTGTVALLLEALLGVDENNLWMDYLTTGFLGVVSDQQHKENISKVFNDLKKQPGDTWAERAANYFKTIGYTDKDIEFVREFLLEK